MAELYDGTAHYIGCDSCETVVPFDEARDSDRWAKVVTGIWITSAHLCPACTAKPGKRWICTFCGGITSQDPALWRAWCEGSQSTFHDTEELLWITPAVSGV